MGNTINLKLVKRRTKAEFSKENTTKQKIRRKANAVFFGISPFFLSLASASIGSLAVVIIVWFFSALLFGALSFFFSWKALQKIKTSSDPTEYKKEQVKAKIGKLLAILSLGLVFLVLAILTYILYR